MAIRCQLQTEGQTSGPVDKEAAVLNHRPTTVPRIRLLTKGVVRGQVADYLYM